MDCHSRPVASQAKFASPFSTRVAQFGTKNVIYSLATRGFHKFRSTYTHGVFPLSTSI
ncbi:hypothetical protein CPB86DRAFT_786227 [Serendipita vermifera]|nr:hypothetical protein CPB86DRAFT_786227 [Serendipita vermifera]